MNSLSHVARRIVGLWGVFFVTFVRGNKALPPVVALLTLLLFAWVVAGTFVEESGYDGTANEADLVQSREPSGSPPVAPALEDRDADSYAAYRNKDPFRQLLAPAAAPSEDTLSGDTPSGDIDQANPSDETTTAPDGNDAGGGAGGGGKNTGGAGTGQRSGTDSDGDGLINRQEERLGQDPSDPDTDNDGTEDGADDSDGDGVPDGQKGNAGVGAGGPGTETGVGGNGGGRPGGDGGTGGADGSDEELFDSGGRIYLR